MKRFAIISMIAVAHFAAVNWLFDSIFSRSWLHEQGTPSFLVLQFIFRVLGFPFIWLADLLPGACSSGNLAYISFGASSVTWSILIWWSWSILARRAKHENIS